MTQKTLATANVSGGIARTSYTIPGNESVGDFTLHGTYQQNNHYKEATDTADFKVRIATTVTVDNVTGNHGESASFTAHVKYDNTSNVNEGQVQFKIENNIIGTANVSNGVATLAYTIPGTVSDGDSITANYLGTSTYGTSATTTAGSVHIRGQVTVTVDAVIANRSDTATLKALVEDSGANAITGGTVEFYIDNTLVGTSSTTGSDDKYSYDYSVPSNATAGSHTIKAVFQQTGDYVSAYNTANMTVRMPVTVTVADASCNTTGNVVLVATVKDENNSIVTEGQVVFKANAKTVKDANNQVIYCTVGNDGTATLTLDTAVFYSNIAEGDTFSITAVYPWTDNYGQTNTTVSSAATLTVRKTPVIVVTDVTANRGDNIYLSAAVTYNSENVTEGSVTFTLEQT